MSEVPTVQDHLLDRASFARWADVELQPQCCADLPCSVQGGSRLLGAAKDVSDGIRRKVVCLFNGIRILTEGAKALGNDLGEVGFYMFHESGILPMRGPLDYR